MKTYSDLQAIDTRLTCHIHLEPVGHPDVSVIAGPHLAGGILYRDLDIQVGLDLQQPFVIQIQLQNKIYTADSETAVHIRSIQIDGQDLVPRFLGLAHYDNDHGFKNPTDYLGFNGKWTLTIDRPFYHWLHEHTGQGWLLG
jgi:hypothetical protein